MIGQQIGPYSILSLLGRGDIGAVYQAVHSASEQLVAIKVLSPELSANPATRDRILSQANRQAGLFHPNVVNVLKYLKDSRGIFLVMEYVQGESLEKQLTRVGALEPPEALRIALKILEAMSFMHKRGVHHCHLKPSDILINGDGNIKVMDFGIAKVFGEKGISVTGMRLESLWYMSPEQLRGEAVDAVSDIYSLGIILYQMLIGEVPFRGKSRFEVMKAHMEETPQDPAAIDPELPRGLCDLILKCLAKTPQDRFQSAEELARDMVRFTEGGEADAVFAFEGPLAFREAEAGGPQFFRREKDASPIPSQAALPFPGRLDWRVVVLLSGIGMILIGFLMHFLFFGDSRKEERIGNRIPGNIAPAAPSPPAPALPVTSGDETAAPEVLPPPEAANESAPVGIDRGLLVTPPFPQAPHAPWEAEIPIHPHPAPSSPAISESDAPPGTSPSEALESENPDPPVAAPRKANAPREKRRPPSEAQPENRRSGRGSAQPPEGEKHGWRIIK